MTTHTTPASTVESTTRAHFAHDFVWGMATASYQIEGAVTEDGLDSARRGLERSGSRRRLLSIRLLRCGEGSRLGSELLRPRARPQRPRRVRG